MSRNRQSAKKAGTAFETLVAAYLNRHVDDRVERRRQTGIKDRGDITGLRHMGQRLVIECKNTTRLNLGPWLAEAELERGNDDAGVAVVAHKRHGKGQAADQLVTMTLGDFVSLLTGSRDHLEPTQSQGKTDSAGTIREAKNGSSLTALTVKPEPRQPDHLVKGISSD